jgi:hypothetical protein
MKFHWIDLTIIFVVISSIILFKEGVKLIIENPLNIFISIGSIIFFFLLFKLVGLEKNSKTIKGSLLDKIGKHTLLSYIISFTFIVIASVVFVTAWHNNYGSPNGTGLAFYSIIFFLLAYLLLNENQKYNK